MSKKHIFLPALLLSAVLFGGCQLLDSTSTDTTTEETSERPNTVITGEVSLVGNKTFITQKAQGNPGDTDGVMQVTKEIVSRKIDLKTYVGKTITVSGEFSGTTLYVDSVQ